jgi:Putative zinc-finger
MDHSEAVKQMAAERYLLNELTPEIRDEFEEHAFDCTECALDLRAGAVFVEEAKAQLPELTANPPAPVPSGFPKPRVKREWWFSWLRPSFAAPAFATLLIILGYQNLVTFPAMRTAASQPRLVPSTALRGATRGGPALTVTADREHGVALPIDLPQQPGIANYASYSLDLFDPQGKLAWTGAASAPGDQPLSLVIPGAMLRSGAYTVAVSGVGQHGERTAIDKFVFNLRVTD